MILFPSGFIAPAAVESGGGGSLPAYMEAAVDGFVTDAPDHTPFTLRGNGRIETWHALKGVIGNVAVSDQSAALPDTSGTFDAVDAANVLTVALAGLPNPPLGILMMMKAYGIANTYYRLCGVTGGSARGLFLWPNTHQLDLESQTASVGARWNGNTTVLAGAGRQSWHSVGFTLPNTGTQPRLWVDGVETTWLTGTYTAPTDAYNAIGASGSFREFYVGEWLWYDDPTGTEMAAHTLAAYNRWNP